MEGPGVDGVCEAASPLSEKSALLFKNATQRFCPPPEAEPSGDGQPADTPTVLTKLQKWGDYNAIGEPVWPTKFVPMKTPMSREILANWSLPEPPRHSLTIPLLLERQRERGEPIGLIIDLANHECLYYDDIPDDIEYETVQLVAKVLPPPEAINEVEKIARRYWRDHPDKYIAIHCAYGFNRTGFVLCSYLCQACGLSVEQALDCFAAARPPGVKHEKFIHELYVRYGGAEGAAFRGSRPPSRAGSSKAASAAGSALVPTDAAAELGSVALAAAAAAAPAELRSSSLTAPPPQAQQPSWQLGGSPQAVAQQQQEQEQPAPPQQQEQQQQPCSLPDKQASESGSVVGSGAAVPAAPAGTVIAAVWHSPGDSSIHRTPSRQYSIASEASPPRSENSGRCDAPASSSGAAAAWAGGGLLLAQGSAEELPLGSSPEEGRRSRSRRSSRGGLTLALAQGSGGGSSRASTSSQVLGSTPPAEETAAGLAALTEMAMHLEGGASVMPRSTSMGLARALKEDFTVNNGTPTMLTPLAARLRQEQLDEQAREVAADAGAAARGAAEAGEVQQGEEEQAAVPGAMPIPAPAAVAAAGSPARSLHQTWTVLGEPAAAAGAAVPGQMSSMVVGPHEAAASPFGQVRASAGHLPVEPQSSSPLCGVVSSRTSSRPDLAGSPSRTHDGTLRLSSSARLGGSPPRPYGFARQHLPLARSLGALPSTSRSQPLGYTPALTPAHAAGTPSTESSGGLGSTQRSMHRVLRSVSVDSENPSLGFGMREALMHLHHGAAAAGARGGQLPNGTAERAPRALGDLFRDDSRKDLHELDVEEHLAAVANSVPESPAAAGPDNSPAIESSAAAGRSAASPRAHPGFEDTAPGRSHVPGQQARGRHLAIGQRCRLM